jgi:ABC-2 type transport system permease protein
MAAIGEANGQGPGGVIHDIGYQRYQGARLGRWYAVRSLYTHSLRTAFGLGRSGKAKVFPWLTVGIVTLVAAIVTAVRSQLGEPVMAYVDFPSAMNVLVIIFCAVIGPELVSRDLRSGVLPLYFSRPLHRGDYAMAKLGATITATFLLLAGPMLLMFVGGSFTLDSLTKVWDEFVDFSQGLAYAGLMAIVFSSIAVLVASLASRRAIAAAVVVAVFLVTAPVAAVLSFAPNETVNKLAGLVNPASLVGLLGHWLFEPPRDNQYGPIYAAVTVALVALCAGFLLLRYRKVAQ